MPIVERHLRLVRTSAAGRASSREVEDVGVTLLILLVAAVPLVSALGGVGRWSEASLGLGAAGVLLAGRELCAALLASWRRP